MSRRPLWAPWRIEYISGPKEDECIFCAAAAAGGRAQAGPRAGAAGTEGRAGATGTEGHGHPASLPLDRTERCLTMLNAFPYAPGHLMVAPCRHVGELEALDEQELLELMRLCRRATIALRAAMAPDAFNIGLNLGRVAGAGIADHLHLHVVPRWQGDTNFMPLLAETNVIPQALEATRALLLDALARQAGGRAGAAG